MKKSLLISIQPQWLYKILNGDKTCEVRKVVPKWVLEALDRGETVEAYLYCTKGKPYLYYNFGNKEYVLCDDKNNVTYYDSDYQKVMGSNLINGTISVKVVIDGYVKYVDCSDCTNNENGYECQNDFMYLLSVDPILRKETCLTSDEIEDYGNGKDLYALHISKVEILDEPKTLMEFYKMHISKTIDNVKTGLYLPVTKAPQNMMSVWVKGEQRDEI